MNIKFVEIKNYNLIKIKKTRKRGSIDHIHGPIASAGVDNRMRPRQQATARNSGRSQVCVYAQESSHSRVYIKRAGQVCGTARNGAQLLLQSNFKRCDVVVYRENLLQTSQLRLEKQAKRHGKAAHQHCK